MWSIASDFSFLFLLSVFGDALLISLAHDVSSQVFAHKLVDKGNVIWETEGEKQVWVGGGKLLLTIPVIVRTGKYSGDRAQNAASSK